MATFEDARAGRGEAGSCRCPETAEGASPETWARLEAAIGIEPMYGGFADLCLTAWLRRPQIGSLRLLLIEIGGIIGQAPAGAQDRSTRDERRERDESRQEESDGAGNGIRTRDFNLGKVALYH